mmetsp:Transcript_54229/g.86767  ORF Transcript_54229/g.86767 Transcript_54229/m.86767 type:complete len:512 (-) Transcript_54229:295-1830(-)
MSTTVEIEPQITHHLISPKKQFNYSSITVDNDSTETSVSSGCSPRQHDAHGATSGNGKSSVMNVLWNFLNITVGIGILSLPYAMLTTGLIATIIALIIFGMISTYTLNLLVISAQKISVFNYEAIAEHCYGSVGYIFTSLCIFIMVFGGLITEFIAIGDASFKIMQLWGYHTQLERQVIMLVISTLLVLPLCLFRDLSKLEHISAIKIFAILFMVAVVIYEWSQMTASGFLMMNMDMNDISVLNIAGLPRTLGIISFSFLCHDCVFLMYNTMANPTLQRWKQVSSFGITGTVLLNLLFSIPAFLTFGSDSDPNIINNYGISNPLFIAVRVVVIVVMALSYPPAFFLVRHIVYSASQRTYASFHSFAYSVQSMSSRSIMSHHQEINTRAIEIAQKTFFHTVQSAPLSHHLATTLIVFFSNLIIALFIDNLGIAMSLIGSISSMNLELVLPALFYIKICVDDESVFEPQVWRESSMLQRLMLMVKNGLCLPMSLVVIGLFFAITGVLSSLNVI